MLRQWLCSLSAVFLILPLLLGCGSSDNSTGSKGLSATELAKVLEADAAAAKVPAPEVTAEKLLESLTADPSAAESAKKEIAARPQMVTGKVVDRSPAGSESCYLMLDGGTRQGKTYKLKFNFAASQQEDANSIKVGDKTRIVGSTDGELKDDILEFKECILSPLLQPFLSRGGPPPLPAPLPKKK